jgi:hypothetical protein
LTEAVEKGDQAAAQGGIDVDMPKNEPLPKPLFLSVAPLLLLLYQLLMIPLLPLPLDLDRQITTKNLLTTSHPRMILMRQCKAQATRRQSKRPWISILSLPHIVLLLTAVLRSL